jgi:hypothetical protein
MEVGKKHHRRKVGQSPEMSKSGGTTDLGEPEVLPPETVEDYLHAALDGSDLDRIIRFLRDWYGREAIRTSLYKIEHRDPVDQFTHIRRHAVELFAKQHGLNATRLMVELVGSGQRKDPERSEREKLKNACTFVSQDQNALIAANALAEKWSKGMPLGLEPFMYLKKLHRETNILSPKSKPEV